MIGISNRANRNHKWHKVVLHQQRITQDNPTLTELARFASIGDAHLYALSLRDRPEFQRPFGPFIQSCLIVIQ